MLWTFDDGELTDRSQLPVTKLNFGNFYEVRLKGDREEVAGSPCVVIGRSLNS